MKKRIVIASSMLAVIALAGCKNKEEVNVVRTEEIVMHEDMVFEFATPRDLENAFLVAEVALRENPEISDSELDEIILTALQDSVKDHPWNEVGDYPAGMTKAEFKLALKHPSAALKVSDCATEATNKTNELYESNVVWKGNGDAFRHAYWNVLMVKAIGSNLAEKFATAHESESPEGVDKEMDLNNNSKGREWANDLKNKNNDDIAAAIVEHVDNGDLQRIVNESLVPTNNEGKKKK